ncbi:ABC transporter permease [Synergistales bacterium]|nr:ABC transporter permease [Synergistales bacterium]
MTFDASYIWPSLIAALQCLHVTLILSFVSFCVGLLLGTPVAVSRKFHATWTSYALGVLIPILKGVPLVLYVLMFNFAILKPLDALSEYYAWADGLRRMDKIYIGLVAMSVSATVMISETMRSALSSVSEGQYEACFSVGLTKWQALRRVVLPQAMVFAAPVLCNNIISLIKGSSIVFVVGIMDVLNSAKTSAQINYRFLEAYIASALVYWVICATVGRIGWFLEKRQARGVAKAGGA